MIQLYTLPNCGICHMIKTKLQEKNISFQEYNLEEYVEILNTTAAPVLKTDNETIFSPSAMVQWINNYGE